MTEERLQLRHALIDVNFASKPKVQALRAEHGPLAELLLVRLICVLSAATDGIARKSVAYVQGHDIGLDRVKVDEILGYLASEQMLTVLGDSMTQERVVEDQRKLAERRASAAQRQQAWRDKRVTSRVTNAFSGRDVTVSPVTDTDTDIGSDLDLKDSSSPLPPEQPEPQPEPEPPDIYELEAEKRLEKPGGGAAWERSPAFMAAGRRPLRKYPEIFLTVFELAHIFREWEGVEFELADIDAGFRTCLARLKSKAAKGERVDTTCVYAWMTSFILHDAVEKKTKVNRLRKSEVRHGANVN